MELIISSICNATFCEAVYDNPLIESQLTKTQIELLALAEELNGKHLKIGTYNNYPLSWTERADNGTLIGGGVAFTIIDILREKFNFTFEVVIPNNNFEFGGSRPEDSLIGLVNSSKVDMVAAFMPTLYKLKDLVSSSVDIDEGVWVMMLKRPAESAAGSGLLAPFESHVWYLILTAVLSYGPCITLLTRLRSKLIKDHERYIPLSPSCWFVYGAFIKQGTTLSPEANTTRVLFATWWLFIILLSAFYTANLTAFLTLSKFTLAIETPRDLYKKNYRWVATQGGTIEYAVRDPDEDIHYLNQMISNGRAEFRSVSNSEDYLTMVKGGAVLVKDRTGIDHMMYADYLNKARQGIEETSRCTYVIAPNSFMKKNRAFIFPKNSKLKKLFDPILTNLLQAGIVNFLKNRDLPSTKICPLDLQSKDRRLRNSDLMMTYLIMVIGLAAAIAVFIMEIIIKKCFHIRLKTEGPRPKRTRANRVRFQNHDETQPPPYESLFGRNSRYKMTDQFQTKIINGREYWVVDTVSGDTRLIPMRTPSAFLYQRQRRM
uniref:Ionotropic receptor n=1 Tax=Eogystia hippophaecolus TaxID=1206364 RepID=A0A1B3P5G3_EOGHI|nr:ionotropic receptor [Eogystia hippophaecolus]